MPLLADVVNGRLVHIEVWLELEQVLRLRVRLQHFPWQVEERKCVVTEANRAPIEIELEVLTGAKVSNKIAQFRVRVRSPEGLEESCDAAPPVARVEVILET